MSKIVQAVNAMIVNPDNITNVRQSGSEYYFVYKNKYKWSVSQHDGNFIVWFYPGSEDIEMISAGYYSSDQIAMVAYNADEIGTREAAASFSELYTILKEKIYGINEVLDDIISDMDPF